LRLEIFGSEVMGVLVDPYRSFLTKILFKIFWYYMTFVPEIFWIDIIGVGFKNYLRKNSTKKFKKILKNFYYECWFPWCFSKKLFEIKRIFEKIFLNFLFFDQFLIIFLLKTKICQKNLIFCVFGYGFWFV